MLVIRIHLLEDPKLVHLAFEFVLKLHELAHVVFVLHRAQQRGVDEGRAHDVDADAILALRRCILQADRQSCPEGASAAHQPHISGGLDLLPPSLW